MAGRKQELVEQFQQLTQQIIDHLGVGSIEAWEGLELTKPQLRTVLFLCDSPRRMSDLADYLGTTLSSATSLIDRLVAKGLVERFQRPSDRRVVLCKVTPLGLESVERLSTAGGTQITDAIRDLTVAELEEVVRGIGILAEGLERRSLRARSPSSRTRGRKDTSRS